MGISSFLGNVLKGALQTDYVRDYQHASRTFLSGNYALFPKFKNQWHIAFELNPEAILLLNEYNKESGGSGGAFYRRGLDSAFGIVGTLPSSRISVLCKSVKLPNFRFETKKYNQYNRQVNVINKISYEPVDIEFHDDSLNLVRSFWDAYYVYYIQDSRYRNYKNIKDQGILDNNHN